MVCAIHQPQYFPWLGYFDKIAKAGHFLIMDQVQLAAKSIMCRNHFLGRDGEIKTLTVPVVKEGMRAKELREIRICEDNKWQKRHREFFQSTFKYSPYKEEVLERYKSIFEKEYTFLLDVVCDTIYITNELLGIETQITFQSGLEYERGDKSKEPDANDRKSSDVLNMCRAMHATEYITGTGASLGFLNFDKFRESGIEVMIQNYQCPVYGQRFIEEFVPNISMMDMLFNIGIDETIRLFWDNLSKDYTYEEYFSRIPRQ